MMKRFFSLLLCAMLAVMPMASVAQGDANVADYGAGEVLTNVLMDSYDMGEQINVQANLGLLLADDVQNDMTKALAELLSKTQVQVSVYNDFGTARVRVALETSGLTLFEADALIGEDGHVQAMTNLTGNYVLVLPEGAMEMTATHSMADYDFGDPQSVAEFRALPALERLKLTGEDMVSLLLNHLLGWVSYMQMDNDGELYQFDDTYINETDTRDAVAQRMLGKIKPDSFNTLLWNVATTLADETGEFQQAVADVLAEMGVTRYQARVFIDKLFTEETIDPATDFVQPSYYIIENKDESPITYNDVSYFFKKQRKCVEKIWDNGTEDMMTMDVSYDENGGMVGFDANLTKFTTLLPYEGIFTYSIKTDEFWQRLHTSHGELQVYNDNRVIGDMQMQFGEEVDGVKHSYLKGQLDVVNQANQQSTGALVDVLSMHMLDEDDNTETFEKSLSVMVRQNGEPLAMGMAQASGMTTLTDEGYDVQMTAVANLLSMAEFVADLSVTPSEYDEVAFAGGQAVDVTTMTDADKEMLQKEMGTQIAKIGLKLMMKPDVMGNLLKLGGALKQ